jgi:hypothetical protein
MLNVSDAFKTAINQPARVFDVILTVGTYTITKDYIKSFTFNDSIIVSDDFEIGTAPASDISLELIDQNGDYATFPFENSLVKVQIGVKLADGTFEYVSLGLFVIDKANRDKIKISLHAIGRMATRFEKPYETTLTYPATLFQIAQDICSKAGVTLVNTSFVNSNYSVPNAPVLAGVTLRKAIAQVAELAAGYAKVNRDGKLEIINIGATSSATITKSNYIDFNNKDLAQASIDQVIVKVGSEQATAGTGSNPLYVIDNMFCQDPNGVVNALYNQLNGLSYMPYNMRWQGNPALECGDKITVVTDKGTYDTIIGNRKLVYSGGLKEEYKVPGKSNTEKNSTGKGSLTIDMGNVKADIKILKDEISYKVEQTDVENTVTNMEFGKNKWIIKKYGLTTQAGTIPTFDLLAALKASLTLEYADNAKFLGLDIFGSDLDNYIGVATTYIYLDSGTSLALQVNHVDGGAVYINNSLVYQKGTAIPSKPGSPNFYPSFSKGWNRIDVLWAAQTGTGDGFCLNTTLSTNIAIKKMNCYYSLEGIPESRIVNSETRIASAELKITPDAITSTVSKSISNASNATTKISAQDSSIRLFGTGWTQESNANYTDGKGIYTTGTSDYLKYTFIGTGFEIDTILYNNRSMVDVYCDDVKLNSTPIDCYAAALTKSTLYSKTDLPYDTHKIKVQNLNQKNASSTGYCFTLDFIKIFNNQAVNTSTLSTQIQQNADSVKIAVGNIGGNNLIKNSSFEFGIDNVNIANGATKASYVLSASPIDGGTNAVDIVTSTAASDSGMFMVIPTKAGYKYTVSAYCLSFSSLQTLRAVVAKSADWTKIATKSFTVDGASAWTRVEITFTATQDNHYFAIFQNTNAASIRFLVDCVQLELGEKATAWSQHKDEFKNGTFEVTVDHARFISTDGSYTEFVPGSTGLKWHNGSTSKDYHYLLAVGTAVNQATAVLDVTITLPAEFKGKNFQVFASVRNAVPQGGGNYIKAMYIDVTSIDTTNATFHLRGQLVSDNIAAQGGLDVTWMAIA